jgi:hypothetical protein
VHESGDYSLRGNSIMRSHPPIQKVRKYLCSLLLHWLHEPSITFITNNIIFYLFTNRDDDIYIYMQGQNLFSDQRGMEETRITRIYT